MAFLIDMLTDERLPIDGEPDVEALETFLKAAVIRDLQLLLNTRSRPFKHGDPLAETVARFGLPDHLGGGLDSLAESRHLAEAIGRAIRIFEPRLDLVSDVVALAPRKGDLSSTFEIEATLRPVGSDVPIPLRTVLYWRCREFEVTDAE